MAKAKYDPLEAAKIGADGEKPKASSAPPAPPPPPPTFKSPEIDVSDVEPAVAAPLQKTELPPRAPLYRVLATCRVSIDGQICLFAKDSVIDSAGYGAAAGVERLIAQGLKIEAL